MNANKQSGVALLEVLISVIILSIGMLGVAALQFSTLKMYQQSNFDIQAQMAFETLREEMRVAKEKGNLTAADFEARFVDTLTIDENLSVSSSKSNQKMKDWVTNNVTPMLTSANKVDVELDSGVYVVRIQWAVKANTDGRAASQITESLCPESERIINIAGKDMINQCFFGYYQPQKAAL